MPAFPKDKKKLFEINFFLLYLENLRKHYSCEFYLLIRLFWVVKVIVIEIKIELWVHPQTGFLSFYHVTRCYEHSWFPSEYCKQDERSVWIEYHQNQLINQLRRILLLVNLLFFIDINVVFCLFFLFFPLRFAVCIL